MVYEVKLLIRQGRGSIEAVIPVQAANPWAAEQEAIRRVTCGGFASPATRTLGIVARPVFERKKA